MAIRIQREVGGNLAELLLTVAETMTAARAAAPRRQRAHRRGPDVGLVLGALPLGLRRCHLRRRTREYMAVLFDRDDRPDHAGRRRRCSMVVGFCWMSKIIKIEV